MVVFEGQTGGIGGHYGRCDWADDYGARFTFDAFGEVTFGSNGYGENPKIKVQLEREYGRFFCSTATCGGFKSWISSLATVTQKELPIPSERLFLLYRLNEYRSGYIETIAEEYSSGGGECGRPDIWHIDCFSGCGGSTTKRSNQENVNWALDRGFTYSVISSTFYNDYKTEVDNFIISSGKNVYLLKSKGGGTGRDGHCYNITFEKITPPPCPSLSINMMIS